MPEPSTTNSGLHYAFAPSPTPTETLALFVTFWNACSMHGIFLLGYEKLRIFHAEDAVFADSTPSRPPGPPSPNAGKKTGRKGWVALPAAKLATLRGSHRIFFSWGVARPPTPGAGSRSAAGRGGAARREARARRLPGSRGARRSPCFSASGHWSSTVTRRALCGFSPLPGQAEGRQRRQAGRLQNPRTGSCNLSRVNLLESGEPDEHGSAIAGAGPGCRTSASASAARP